MWAFNLLQYPYVIYNYFSVKDLSESRFARSWIPLDVLLTTLVAIYYYGKRNFIKHKEDEVETYASKFWHLQLLTRNTKTQLDSIYDIQHEKVQTYKMAGDAVQMGFAAFLKKEKLGLSLSYQQQSYVAQNSIIIQLVQVIMLYCCFNFERMNWSSLITPSDSYDMMVARFMSSIMMHINVEQDVKNGIHMMKYVVNHHEDFHSPYMPFIFGFFSMVLSIFVEINVMIILTALPDVLGIIVRYIALSTIANVPRYYFASLVDSEVAKATSGKNISITKFRHMKPLENAPRSIKCMRVVYKFCRVLFCAVGFYFMPFLAIIFNFRFMVGSVKHSHIKDL